MVIEQSALNYQILSKFCWQVINIQIIANRSTVILKLKQHEHLVLLMSY